jgi:hypothetical protein
MTDRCNKEVYDNGVEVFRTHTIPSKELEKWVQKIRLDSCQNVDWSYSGGRAIILALGDIAKVRETINNLRETHDDLYWHALKKLVMFTDESIAEQVKGIWQYNGYGI